MHTFPSIQGKARYFLTTSHRGEIHAAHFSEGSRSCRNFYFYAFCTKCLFDFQYLKSMFQCSYHCWMSYSILLYANKMHNVLFTWKNVVRQNYLFKRQPRKMVKYTQTIRQLFLPTNCLSVFDHFVRLELKGLRT